MGNRYAAGQSSAMHPRPVAPAQPHPTERRDDSLCITSRAGSWRATKEKDFLIFDQFEELFTYPEKAVDTFARDLSNCCLPTFPTATGEELERKLVSGTETLPRQSCRLPPTHGDRAVMAIRSDRMSLLNKLKPFLPQVWKTVMSYTAEP